jgi:hypothetical protein
LTGTLGCVTSSSGKLTMLVMGAKSRTGSYGSFSYRLGFTAIGPAAPTASV